jgi:hypothetical protein
LGCKRRALHGISDWRIEGEFLQVLCNLAITRATHPLNQTGKKHVSFASWQLKVTLQCTNSGLHDKPEIHSDSTPICSPDLAPSDFWLFSKLKETLRGQHFSTDVEVDAAVRKRISINPETFFMDEMNKCIEWLKKMCSRKWWLWWKISVQCLRIMRIIL